VSPRPHLLWLPRLLATVALAAAAALCAPAPAPAATMTFGSSLGAKATLNTADDLGYEGSNVADGPSIFHIAHDGADTLLWNVALPGGAPQAPSGGQLVGVALKGCAQRPAGAPEPLTEIHFQSLVPQPGGGFKIALTSQAFNIPVCGAGGASGDTVTSYQPTNFCVNQGDYIAFNDEGGFVPAEHGLPPYPAGVPYMVIAASPGATMDSFMRNGGTNNGTTISPSDHTYHDGFASDPNQELLLQATLATGPDAISWCPGGGKPQPSTTSGYSQQPVLPPLRIGKQTDGINHRRIAAIAMYCRLDQGCSGVLAITPQTGARKSRPTRVSFSIPGKKTSHLAVRVPATLVALARHRRRGVPVKVDATVAGKGISQTITLRIF
jgi:hypothetical protein